MHTLIALIVGAVLAGAAVTALVHNNTAPHPAPTRVLFSYGSG